MVKSIIPKSKTGQFFFFLADMLISYFVLCANTRVIAKGYYIPTMITDGLIATQNTIIGKYCIEDENGRSWAAIAGAVVGGMLGSCLSIWTTKHLFGE